MMKFARLNIKIFTDKQREKTFFNQSQIMSSIHTKQYPKRFDDSSVSVNACRRFMHIAIRSLNILIQFLSACVLRNTGALRHRHVFHFALVLKINLQKIFKCVS